MIQVRYIYSACIVIATPDVRILCDPWFTDRIYDGSWYQFPKLEDPITKIGEVDYIYVSHIHPDHYDPIFLQTYLKKYPQVKVVIGNFNTNFLSKKMNFHSIPHEIITTRSVKKTHFSIILNEKNNVNNVDTALAVKWQEHSVVNMNDNRYSQQQIDQILAFCESSPQIALMSYTGAGPYPQTYYKEPDILIKKAYDKKIEFFKRYENMRDALTPKIAIPFAGKYLLGGCLSHLNPYRGVADAVEITNFDPNAVVLDDGGDAVIDTMTLIPSRIRTTPYHTEEIDQYCQSIANNPMIYEKHFKSLPEEIIPFQILLSKAFSNAIRKSTVEKDYFFSIKLKDDWFLMNTNKTKQEFSYHRDVKDFTPRSEILINLKYLFGLLTCIYHWNNAEVGSQYFVNRTPDIYDAHAQSFLNFFHL